MSCRRTRAASPPAAPVNSLDAARRRIDAATCDIVARDIDRDRHVDRVLEDVYRLKAQHWLRVHRLPDVPAA